MNITFSSTFTLLQHEVALMEGCLSIGLTALRNATVSDKRKFYSGFFNTSIAFERLMKLIVVVDHMLSNNFDPPTKKQLKTYGHDLSQLYQLSVDAANRNKITGITMPIKGSIEEGILRFLSEFAKSSRYYNLNSLNSRSLQNVDPLIGWEEVINRVIKEDVPEKKIKKQIDAAKLITDKINGMTFTILHDMSGESLSTLQALDLPARQLLAAPHLMIRVFKILSPLIDIASKLSHIGFYTKSRDGTSQHIPPFKETLVDYMLNDAEIKRKKRWP